MISSIKNFLKKSPWVFSLLLACKWRLHLWVDWWGTKVWTKTTVTETPLGFKLQSGLHPAYEMMRKATFEVDETQVIQRLLPQMGVFVDIGANLGYYSCLALKHGVHTIAFEPQQQNLACLYNNFQINGWQDNFEIFPMALSDKPGILTLYGASGPSASLIKGWAGYGSKNQKSVSVNCLDIFLTDRFVNQNILIKIDVEGAEYSVLLGALATLARKIKPIWLLEVCFDEFHPNGINPDYLAIFSLFESYGYQAFSAQPVPLRITAEQIRNHIINKTKPSDTFNYIFVDDSWFSELLDSSGELQMNLASRKE